MNCEQALGLISARLDREITPEDARELDWHLNDCGACRAAAEAFALQDTELRRAFEPRRAAAATVAASVTPHLEPPPRRLRRWLPVAIGAAALAASIAAYLLLPALWVPQPQPRPGPTGPSFADLGGLTPRQRGELVKPSKLAVGQSLTTKPGERKRLLLDDGSILYMDRDTVAEAKSPRRVRVERGNVYVEVAPNPGERFVVETPTREVEAYGTRFEVQVADQGTGVVVTQGKVLVTGVDDYLVAGQQIAPGEKKPTPAARASYLLDWTRDLMEQATAALLPPSQHAGGSLIAKDSNGQEAKLSLRTYNVDVHIEDGFARTTIDQTYFNHHPWRLEGTFSFPLPADASLSQLTMYVNGDRQEGGMVERQQGRAIYQKIVNGMRDPALLEWVDGTTFRMRVFPLEGRQEKRILLSYTQRLPSLYGRATYRFPAGHSLQTVRDWQFSARIKDGKNVAAICPTHPGMKSWTEGNDRLLTAQERNVKVDRDVVLLVPLGMEARRGESVEFRHALHENHLYSMTRFRPELPVTSTRQRRDWVFLYEASADRDPLLARVQIEVIRNLLSQAEHNDRFFVVAANSRVHMFELFGSEATPDNIKKAVEWLEKTHLVGALDLGAAFEQVGGILNALENPHLVHLGSGHPGMGRDHERLKNVLPPKAKYVGIGVGKRWARAFMKERAETTGGLVTQINPDEQITWRTFELLATLNTPRILNLKATFEGADMPAVLVDQAMLSQGEELCITTRVPAVDGKGRLPAQLVITGTVDNQDYRKVIDLQAGPGGAGYLPRTWARLEIDRLLAEDARKHKDEIVALSKASYVMSPFTSLLVLENEAMYKEFKVEQGRKDHWAAFAAPNKIPVVYEPDPTQLGDQANAPRDRKPNRAALLNTIYVHVPAKFLRGDGEGQNNQSLVVALEAYRGAFAEPQPDDRVRVYNDVDGGDQRESLVYGTRLAAEEYGIELGLQGGEGFYANGAVTNGRFFFLAGDPQSRTPENKARKRLASQVRLGESLGRAKLWSERNEPLAVELFDGVTGLHSSNSEVDRLFGAFSPDGRELAFQTPALGLVVRGTSRLPTSAARPVRIWDVEDRRKSLHFLADFDEVDFGKRSSGRSVVGPGGVMQYQRLVASDDRRLRNDLLSYAPGLNTSSADIEAIIEAEGEPDLRNVPGRIAPAALKLIDAARQGGWLRYERAGQPAILFDASGRYVVERTLPIGLREEVVCDGATTLSVYTELGLAGTRTVSRHHRAAFAASLPHVVLPAGDLARGHDLEVVAPRIIALVPHNVGDKEHYRRHLVFAENGRLAERQVVRMPGATVVLRQVLLADGVSVKQTIEGKEKELARETYKFTPVPAPTLTRDLAPLVVLELPLRTRPVVFEQYKLDPNNNLDDGANGGYRHLPRQDAVQLLAHLAITNHHDLMRVYHTCFLERDDLRPGLLTLLAGHMEVGRQYWFPRFAEAHPNSPLVKYFGMTHNPLYAEVRGTLPLDLSRGVGPAGSFLRRLARYHELADRWYDHGATLVWDLTRRTHLSQALAFIAEAPASPLARTLLVKMQANGRLPAGGWLQLADAWAKLDRPGERYRAQYERAVCLYNANVNVEDRAWSAQAAEELLPVKLHLNRFLNPARAAFLKTADEALAAGILPPLDDRFYHAVRDRDGGPNDPWLLWVERTADTLIEKDRREAVLTLANRVRELGDPALADNLVVRCLANAAAGQRTLALRAAVVAQLLAWNQPDTAAVHLAALLDEPTLKDQPGLYRLAYRLAYRVAEARGQTAAKFAYLETALRLEPVPEVIELEAWRQDHRPLLAHYHERAQVLADLGQRADAAARADLIRRTVWAIDHLRANDPEAGNDSAQAGHTLRLLGAEELAWDYLTTPHAGKDEVPSLHGEASSLSRTGASALGDRMYRVAIEAEPTNVALWWDRAQALHQAGRTADAKALFQALAEGTVNKDDQVYRERARWWLQQR